MKKLLSNPLTDVILSALAILAAVANAALAACEIGYLNRVTLHSSAMWNYQAFLEGYVWPKDTRVITIVACIFLAGIAAKVLAHSLHSLREHA